MFIEVILLIVACIAIWLSTGFVIESIEKLSSHTKLSRFTLSLFVIGVVTSFPEIAVTLSSVMLRSPQIALGNLIGSQIFLLFFVIPVLAIISQGLHLHQKMRNLSLGLTLLVVFVSIAALFDQRLDLSEVLIILGIYGVFVATFFRQGSHLERTAARIQEYRSEAIYPSWEVAKIIVAVSVLLLASHAAVREMIEIAAFMQTPRFLFSMLVLPIGTNLPELSLALGSLAVGKKGLALADYMGALTFNSLLIALLAISSGGSIMVGQNISWVVLVFVGGLATFWWCCFSRELLSIKEGLILLLLYLALLGVAVGQIMSGVLG